ncbi:MAG: monovalent cation/H+ antiporter subunit D [Bradymonadaceae bacterium]|nr:monovalent cation/H+ antiporter subunit D [Lujinxingiaceae bacterium]
MNHWLIFPILIPILAALVIPLFAGKDLALQRGISLTASLATMFAGLWMLRLAAGGEMFTYALGNWPAPFGIVLVLDGLSAVLVALTGVIGLFALLYAMQGTDEKGPFFHVLFQMQIAGICGAFLTGDLFNLFVFFEILLLASYNLLVFSGGEKRLRAGVHYVILNLIGSGLFLLAVGTLYGVTGTLNMAHMAVRVSELGASETALVQASALLLIVVFALKAAMLPLYLWLPNVYSSATAPVAALFSVLTKVGVYAILRTSTLIFGAEAGVAADLLKPYLMPLALLTLVLGWIGAMGSHKLRKMLGYMIIASLGLMMASMGLFTTAGISAGIYYMLHSTVVMALMFLLVDLIARQRGPVDDALVVGWTPTQGSMLGVLFFGAVIAAAGLPPLSGFIGKMLILQAAIDQPNGFWMWAIVLITSLIALVALSRAGSLVFFKTDDVPPGESAGRASLGDFLPVVGLLVCIALFTAYSGPVTEFTNMTAAQLLEPSFYITNVLGR